MNFVIDLLYEFWAHVILQRTGEISVPRIDNDVVRILGEKLALIIARLHLTTNETGSILRTKQLIAYFQ